MNNHFVILATPAIMDMIRTDLTITCAIPEVLATLLRGDLAKPEEATTLSTRTLQLSPRIIMILLYHGGSTPEYVIFSGSGEGMGPPDRDVPSKARGIFPSIGCILAGRWEPLERLHIV